MNHEEDCVGSISRDCQYILVSFRAGDTSARGIRWKKDPGDVWRKGCLEVQPLRRREPETLNMEVEGALKLLIMVPHDHMNGEARGGAGVDG